MPKLPEMNRSEETKEKYKKRAVSLFKKARKEFKIPEYESLNPKQFVGWLIADRNNLHYNSWKQYKASIISYFEDFEHIDKNEKEEILDLLKEAVHEVGNKKTKNTSNKKMKKFPTKDFLQILDYLQSGRVVSKYKDLLFLWLNAGILTGLRPVEWATAKYIDEKGKERLIVENAKNSNGRAHGDYRTIILDKLTENEREYIKAFVKEANYYHSIDKYSSFQKGCADLLTSVGKKIFKNRSEIPCLYSLRHQFSADAKASGLSLEEIAALMGHSTNDTATVHYAKKSSGKNSNVFCRVKASAEEVARIRQIYQNPKSTLENSKNITLKGIKLTNIVK